MSKENLEAIEYFKSEGGKFTFVTGRMPYFAQKARDIMALDDEMGNLMTLELMAPDQRQAIRLSRMFEKKAEMVYNLVMTELLDEEEEADI